MARIEEQKKFEAVWIRIRGRFFPPMFSHEKTLRFIRNLRAHGEISRRMEKTMRRQLRSLRWLPRKETEADRDMTTALVSCCTAFEKGLVKPEEQVLIFVHGSRLVFSPFADPK